VNYAAQCFDTFADILKRQGKSIYSDSLVFFDIVFVLGQIALLQYGKYFFIGFHWECIDSNDACLGISAALRLAFSLSVLDQLMFALSFVRNEFVASINDGAWY